MTYETEPKQLASDLICIEQGSVLYFLHIDDIISCRTMNKTTVIDIKGIGHYKSSKSLKFIEDALGKRILLRISSSCLVNINMISQFIGGNKPHVVLTTGESLPVSRGYKDVLLGLVM